MGSDDQKLFDNEDAREAQRLFEGELHDQLSAAPAGYEIGIDLSTKRGYVAPTLLEIQEQAKKDNPYARLMVKESGSEQPWGRMFLDPEAEKLLKRFEADEISLFTVVRKENFRPALFAKLDRGRRAVLLFASRELAAETFGDAEWMEIQEVTMSDVKRMAQEAGAIGKWSVKVIAPPKGGTA